MKQSKVYRLRCNVSAICVSHETDQSV